MSVDASIDDFDLSMDSNQSKKEEADAENYNKNIKDAEVLFSSKQYIQAISKYSEALQHPLCNGIDIDIPYPPQSCRNLYFSGGIRQLHHAR